MTSAVAAFLALALNSAVPVSAQNNIREYCAERGMVPDGDEGSSEWGCKPAGGTGSGPAFDYGAAERLRQEQLKRQKAVRLRLESEEIERKDRERKLFDDVSRGIGTQLKGVPQGNALGLKGMPASGGGSTPMGNPLGLKGLQPEAEREPKPCRVVNTCSEALRDQDKALDSARREQSDFYVAAAKADLQHGLNEAKALLPSVVKERTTRMENDVTLFYWRNADKNGLPYYLRDYKTNVDGIVRLRDLQTAAATRAAKLMNLKDSEAGKALKADYDKHKAGLEKASEQLESFAKYMEAVGRCVDGAPSRVGACMQEADDAFDEILDGVVGEIHGASLERVKAAREAYRGYTRRALERAQKLATAASKCFKGCE